MTNLMKVIYWRAFVICLSLKWVFKFNIGDLVWYQNEQWTLSQGVKSPIWTLRKCQYERCDSKGVEVSESDFSKVKSLANYWGSFRSGYRFYMGYWYDIWKRDGIQDWMRDSKIGLPKR